MFIRIKISPSISAKLERKLGQQKKATVFFFPPKQMASSFKQAQETPAGLVTIISDANDGMCQGERNVMWEM